MDPAGLLVSVNATQYKLDKFSATYRSAAGTLGHIASQIQSLKSGTERMQEWLHFTDPSSKIQITFGLRDAMATINHSLQRLQYDLEAIHGISETAASGGKELSPYNEAQMKKHLTDVRECVCLLRFGLNVCQL